MATAKQRVYVRGSHLPFEEDATHEFKGHREIAPEDTPPWAFRNPCETQTRQAISRNLNAFLNTSRGGVVYCGVDDRGRVLGLHLTRYQKDHVLLSVRSVLLRYRPAVPSNRHRITFVPVVSVADVHNPPSEFAYDVSRRSKQHLVATSDYCWCDADARARSVSGVIPLSYVIEIAILQWADRDRSLHPYYLTESGKCYVRRQASVLPLTASDCIRITRHEAAALSRLQSDQVALASQRDAAALQARLDAGQLWPATRPACRCSAGSDTPQTPAGTDAEGGVPLNSDGCGEKSRDRPESGAASAVQTLPRVLSQESSADSDRRGGHSSGRDLVMESRSNDTGLAQSSRELSSSTSTELAHSSRKLFHSSSSDSGLGLSCSPSDTGLARKQFSSTDSVSTRKLFFGVSKATSSSSDGNITHHRDRCASAAVNATSADPVASELTQPLALASGIQAVSALLQEVLSSSMSLPPPDQSPVGDAAAATARASVDGVTVSDSELPPPGGARLGTGLDGSESDVSLPVTGAAGDASVFDLGESGCSEMSLLVPESAPERPLMDLGTSGTDLGVSETDLGVMEANMGASEADIGASGTDLGASEADLCVMEADWVDSETDLGVLATGLAGSRADICAREATDPGASGSDLGISVTDASLLELESVAEWSTSQRNTRYSAVAMPAPASMTPSFLVTTESDSALTTEAESDYAAVGEESLSSVSEPTLDSLSARRVRRSPLVRRGGSGPERSPPTGVPAGMWKFPLGIRGRGKALETAGKVPEAVGKVPEAVGKVPEPVGKVLDVVGKVPEAAGKLGTLQLGIDPAEEYGLDSDDSEDSWDAGFRPERRLVEPLLDSATVL